MRKETILAIWTKFLLYGGFGGLCLLLAASCQPQLFTYAYGEGCFAALLELYNIWWSFWLFLLMLIAGVWLSVAQWIKACKGDKEGSKNEEL